MAHPARDGSNDFNDKTIEEFRADEGRVGGLLVGTPMILGRDETGLWWRRHDEYDSQ